MIVFHMIPWYNKSGTVYFKSEWRNEPWEKDIEKEENASSSEKSD